MKRRRFTIAGGILSVCLPFVSFSAYPLRSSPPPDLLLAKFLPPQDTRSIGLAYLKADPDFDHTSLFSLGPAQLQEQIQTDFATENTVTVTGWVLSRTEARWFAARYLQNQ